MAGRPEQRSWARRMLVLLNVSLFLGVLLWIRGDDPWWLGVPLAWGWFSAAFFRWFDLRSRRTAAAGAAVGRGRPLQTPAALQNPPPRAWRAGFSARAARHYRRSYPGLLVLPIVLGEFWFWRTSGEADGLSTMHALVILALVVAVVLYVESNVRLVGTLVRDGAVVQGTVVGVQPVRNRVTVRFVFEGAARSVAVPVDDVRDLGPPSQVPVLVRSGSSLVGMVTAGEAIVVARAER